MGAEPWSPSFGTRIWLPSERGAARLSDVSIAPGRAPPAASIASITRAPSSNSYTPGCRTHPATSTSRITVGEGLAVAAGAGIWSPAFGDATATGFGSDRTYQRPAPPSVTASSETRPTSSARESAERRSRNDPSGTGSPSISEGGSATLVGNGGRNRDGLHIRWEGRERGRAIRAIGLGTDGDLVFARRHHGQPEGEGRAALGRVADVELPPVRPDEAARDVQAEAGPRRPRVVCPA